MLNNDEVAMVQKFQCARITLITRHLLVSLFNAKLASAVALQCYAANAVPAFPLLQHLCYQAIPVLDVAGKYGNFAALINSLLGLMLSCAISGSVTCGWK